jgi:hypothetical protein
MTVEEGLDFVNQTDGMEGVWYLPDKTIVYSDQFESLYLYQLPE